eukprot:8749229-Alexandrium_andersonii.AAC.1
MGQARQLARRGACAGRRRHGASDWAPASRPRKRSRNPRAGACEARVALEVPGWRRTAKWIELHDPEIAGAADAAGECGRSPALPRADSHDFYRARKCHRWGRAAGINLRVNGAAATRSRRCWTIAAVGKLGHATHLSLIHISEPTRLALI